MGENPNCTHRLEQAWNKDPGENLLTSFVLLICFGGNRLIVCHAVAINTKESTTNCEHNSHYRDSRQEPPPAFNSPSGKCRAKRKQRKCDYASSEELGFLSNLLESPRHVLASAARVDRVVYQDPFV